MAKKSGDETLDRMYDIVNGPDDNVIDPIAYRSDYRPEDINPEMRNDPNLPSVGPSNANEHFNQYGDDSNQQWQTQKGGRAEKYTGEGVKTSMVDYDPNINTQGLDPNYLFGNAARNNPNKENGYLAKRNDMIASALYNEGRVSREDVANYLSAQKGWFDSTEADRQNTIESIYKRIGQMSPKEETSEEKPKDSDKADVIYGKVGTEEDGTVIANIDRNAILNEIDSARIANANALASMQPKVAAAATYQGQTPYGSQALRDVQSNNPEWYNQYQQELKKLYTQDEINNISHGSAETGSGIVYSADSNISNDEKTWQDQNINNDNAEYANSSYQEKLNNNKTATSAKEQMSQIKMDIVDLQDEIDGLKAKANNIFPADTPDYIVQGYIANHTQELNKKIQNLENKFLSLSDIYKTEVGNIQREMEYQLKVDAANREAFNEERDRYYKEAQLENDLVQWSEDANGNLVGFKYDPKTNTMRQVTDGEAYDSYNNAVSKVAAKAKSYVGKSTGKQCLGFTNMLTKEAAGVTMQSANGGEVLAKDRIAYATDPNVSDYIPVVGDVAVGVGGPYNSYYGHTMYVDNVWTDESGEVWFHYIATNDGKHEDKTIAYEGSKRVKDFYANGGVGFWNPFKQVQYNNRGSTSYTDDSIYLDPMEPVVDAKYREGDLTVTKETILSRFWSSYNKLYSAREDGGLLDLLNSNAFSTFLKDFSFDADEVGNDGNSTAGDLVSTFMDQIKQAGAKYFNGNGYNAFLGMMGVLETKLRDESGAKINNGEWKMDFMQYVPESSDNPERRLWKINNLEKYLRGYAKRGTITADQYIPLFEVYGVGSDGKIYDKRKGNSTTSAGKKVQKRTSRIYE